MPKFLVQASCDQTTELFSSRYRDVVDIRQWYPAWVSEADGMLSNRERFDHHIDLIGIIHSEICWRRVVVTGPVEQYQDVVKRGYRITQHRGLHPIARIKASTALIDNLVDFGLPAIVKEGIQILLCEAPKLINRMVA